MAESQVKYERKSVKAVRGLESRTIAKWQGDGWELVDQATSGVATTLQFRRPKALLPWRLIALGATAAVVLATVITIGALREGNGDTSDAQASPSATELADAAPIVETTVDELLDRLNSADLGGIELGDRFRLTAELFESDAWGVGASGDFAVMLKAKGGADDLLVFVTPSDADQWQDGTTVEFVVEMVEVTIDGETTGGWLRADEATTLSGGTSQEAKDAQTQESLFQALTNYAATLNSATGTPFIDRIEPGSGDETIDVHLDLSVASASELELKTAIQTINGQLVDVASSNGADRPIVKYYLAGDVVAQNRYIVDPLDVKFEGILDD